MLQTYLFTYSLISFIQSIASNGFEHELWCLKYERENSPNSIRRYIIQLYVFTIYEKIQLWESCEERTKKNPKSDEHRPIVEGNACASHSYMNIAKCTTHIFNTAFKRWKEGREFDCNRDIYRIIIIFFCEIETVVHSRDTPCAHAQSPLQHNLQ